MNLFHIPQPAPKPAAQLIAENELAAANCELIRRVEYHRNRFTAFWSNPKATPDVLLEQMGGNAQLYLALAQESAESIARIAALLGMTLDDVLPPQFYAPQRAFVVGENGTLTLEPIPEPPSAEVLVDVEPEPEP